MNGSHSKNANSQKTWETYLYYGATPDQERTVERGWDYGTETWTSYELHLDYRLNPTWKQTNFDNGTHTIREWDYRATRTWDWRETSYSGSTKLWQRDQFADSVYIYRDWTNGTWDEIETRYNSGGLLYYQHRIDGVTKVVHEWDRADNYDWVERIVTTVSGRQSRVETIYGSYKTVEIFDLTGNQDWTRHVQVWRGDGLQNKVEDKYYDGARLIKELAWDYSGRSWDHYEKRFHNGTVVYHKVINDNNTYTLDRVDYEGRSWDTISISGKIIGGVETASRTETLYDDSLMVVERKDLGNEDWDTRIVKSREYGGVRLNFLEGITFDAPKRDEVRWFTHHYKFWDRADTNPWEILGIFSLNDGRGGPWDGFIVWDTGDAGGYDFEYDFANRIKAWDGLTPIL